MLTQEKGSIKQTHAHPLIRNLLLLQKYGFIKQVDKGWITNVKDLESWCLER